MLPDEEYLHAKINAKVHEYHQTRLDDVEVLLLMLINEAAPSAAEIEAVKRRVWERVKERMENIDG